MIDCAVRMVGSRCQSLKPKATENCRANVKAAKTSGSQGTYGVRIA